MNTKARRIDVDESIERLEVEGKSTGTRVEELKQQIELLRKDQERIQSSLEKVANAVHIRLEREREWAEKSWSQKLLYLSHQYHQADNPQHHLPVVTTVKLRIV